MLWARRLIILMLYPSRIKVPSLLRCPFLLLSAEGQKPKDPRYPTELKTIVDRLWARRMDLGLRQKDVAKLLGVTVDSVCYWENGRRVPPCRNMLRRLANFLEAPSNSSDVWAGDD
jgi:DNA-binding transcriptional regulator YiaG